MRRFEQTDVQALVDVVGSITRREGTYSFLGSVEDLAKAGEPDFAIDHLAGGLLGWELRISLDEFAVIKRLCHAWDTVDRVDDFASLVASPSTDPQPQASPPAVDSPPRHLTCDTYGRVKADGTPVNPTTYDYRRAARDAIHFPQLVDRSGKTFVGSSLP